MPSKYVSWKEYCEKFLNIPKNIVDQTKLNKIGNITQLIVFDKSNSSHLKITNYDITRTITQMSFKFYYKEYNVYFQYLEGNVSPRDDVFISEGWFCYLYLPQPGYEIHDTKAIGILNHKCSDLRINIRNLIEHLNYIPISNIVITT